ncbi:winged helix-turn-helix transcriptional regulator [Aeromicrobium wangtongii]|uniref:Helix-turn-helix transcriptional regulator n=1 Tax=Aeromicrobium wangtongii TaxID=2969247 RepID=A0ABY5M8P1_9ACTN|nr:helix-turn-helix domain-containing protein [Aeromicrobium wangtongii]MCD9199860.1 helix-turn-helix transcriptional regulator [Aeromicrobium wangtongii]UUP13479.1 helix-turn-helix transcriptional regulator [Aeromicrobium wangtongii]
MTSGNQRTPDVGDAATPLEPDGPNSIAVANGLLGDEWSLWIIRMALRGATHYTDWLKLGPIPGTALTTRLATLVQAGVLVKHRYHERPARYEYLLTTRGRQVWPILIAMWAWERSWVRDETVVLPRMRHTTCGSFTEPVLTCDSCRRAIRWREIDGRIGPSGDWSRNLPITARRQRSRSDKRPSEVVDETMELIGNRWSIAILGASFLGVKRFNDFQRRLSASPTIIADRLQAFCELGVLDQVPTAERADWMEYRLTSKGLAFLPVVLLVIQWGHRWFVAPDGPALIMQHTVCESPLHVILTCSACHEPLRGHTIEAVHADDPGTPAPPG